MIMHCQSRPSFFSLLHLQTQHRSFKSFSDRLHLKHCGSSVYPSIKVRPVFSPWAISDSRHTFSSPPYSGCGVFRGKLQAKKSMETSRFWKKVTMIVDVGIQYQWELKLPFQAAPVRLKYEKNPGPTGNLAGLVKLSHFPNFRGEKSKNW